MTISIPEPTKTPKVTINLTVTFDAKPNMSLTDMAGINEKVSAFVAKAREVGTVTGSVVVGKQKYNLEG